MPEIGPRTTRLYPAEAARLGLPEQMGTFRLYLALAVGNPEGFSAAIAAVPNTGLHQEVERLDHVIKLSSLGIGYLIPREHEPELVLMLEGLKARIHAEAACRGVYFASASSSRRN